MRTNLESVQRFIQTASLVSLLLMNTGASAQGTFQNLDFEQASVSPTPVNGYGGELEPALLFPGWTVGSNTNAYHLYTLYNNLTLDSPAVNLIGPLFPNGLGINSLQGSYSAVLQYSAYFQEMTFLSQIALLPAGTRSMSFAISSAAGIYAPNVTLNGVSISLVPISGGRLAGDVTAFAGSTVDLRFNAVNWITLFDDVRFSNQPVPEPGILSLSVVGALVVCLGALSRRCQSSAANLTPEPTAASASVIGSRSARSGPRSFIGGCGSAFRYAVMEEYALREMQ